MKFSPDVEKVLITKENIALKVAETAKTLSEDYADKFPLMICILKGACVFFSDLIRAMTIYVDTDFMAISSYGNGTVSGQFSLNKDVSTDITGRDVVVVEDIVDTGNTLKNLVNLLEVKGAKSVKICCLLNKPSKRVTDIEPDYACFEIPDEFVIGYGLDYAEKYRNLEDICIIKSSAVLG